jgi:2-dehydro-3-deoxy-D-arabinonate dehydratase
MKLAKVRLADGSVRVASVEDQTVKLLDLSRSGTIHCLGDILREDDPVALARLLIDEAAGPLPAGAVRFLAPIDSQEVWAAGVTYKRSQIARMEESESGASHYDKVYSAPRPELFFKGNARRTSGPGEPVRVRADSRWTVPEPEFTLVVSPKGKLVGYTIGNDMSARDIEGENPLYLPQAKVYNQCCALGPCILLADQPLDRDSTKVKLTIHRAGRDAFAGETHLGMIVRGWDELIGWLTRENDLPDGAFLLTGTGVVPPDEFTLEDGDSVSIEVTGIGTLTNPVVKAKA